MKQPKKRVLIDIPENMDKPLKFHAINKEISMKKLIENIIEEKYK